MQNIQNLIHDEAGRIPKWKVLFDLFNYVRAACFF